MINNTALFLSPVIFQATERLPNRILVHSLVEVITRNGNCTQLTVETFLYTEKLQEVFFGSGETDMYLA